MGKGQTFLSDFTVSMAVFSVIVVAFFIPWNTVIEANSRFDQAEDMKTQVRRTSVFLTTTPGYPSDWEKDTVNATIPGFATGENILSRKKIAEFANMSYDNQTELLQAQHYYLTIINEKPVKINGRNATYGKNPANTSYNPDTVVTVTRDIAVNGTEVKPAKLKYSIWRERR
ncbi:MAG: hypothetical protein ABEJ93_00070 [Candidatus Nanohalobium sp.]